ncbi:MAG: 5-histidylcysteine sulfoxide synthase [Planctomycetes bacterium]|nr:5-histidylcysteine sulfoxide synthase [Planctomycetota bacterium]
MNPLATIADHPSVHRLPEFTKPLVPTKTVLVTGAPDAGDPVAAKRMELRQYFQQTCELYERLFSLIRDESAYYERYEPLRHPLIFYFAHPAVFYVNKLTAGRFIPKRLDARLEATMAVGVDEMSWDDLNTAHYDWPSVAAVREYRASLREVIDDFIQSMPLELPIRQDSPAWIILMGIEHERIHLETSSVIMRLMPLDALRHGEQLSDAERVLWAQCTAVGPAPANEWLPVEGRTIRLGKADHDHTFGWDNEYGEDEIHLVPFKAARRLVSNAEFLAFVVDGGYQQEAWWTEEGRGWLHYTRAAHPRFWRQRGRAEGGLRDGDGGGGFLQRNLLAEVPLPLNWPVEVNCLEAQAYCAWLSSETGESVQLPTEAQWYALRGTVPAELSADQPDWQRAPGNINLEHGASSMPVDAFPQGEFCDVIGNVWQWTRTPIMPFKGFEVHPLYDDFSVPTFDGRHNLIKGGSWISTGNEALASARYAFRRHFFQHAGFRTVIGERSGDDAADEAITGGPRLYETDQLVTQYLEFHYGPDALGVPNFPKACVEETMRHVAVDRRRTCLDIGCSVGRSALEFGHFFEHVDAVDFSARFIRAGVRLRQGDEVLYEIPTEGELTLSRAVSLDRLGLADVGPHVLFMQGDACNLKERLTGYDLVFAGNLIDRLYDPGFFLSAIAERILPGGLLVMTSPYTWLEEYTPKAKWIGGRREHGEPLPTFAGLTKALETRFSLVHRADLPFVIRETSRKHQHTVAELTVWRRPLLPVENSSAS